MVGNDEEAFRRTVNNTQHPKRFAGVGKVSQSSWKACRPFVPIFTTLKSIVKPSSTNFHIQPACCLYFPLLALLE
jgi:hypothetical protein